MKAEYGITLIGVDDWVITVSAEGQYKPVQIVANHIPQTPIVIQKVDSTTGKAIPLSCSFQLFNADGELVTYNDRYADEVVDTWTTLSSGKCTLPMKLDEGTYRLHEVESPKGYVLGGEDIEFTVDEYRTWDDPITVTYADAPIRAAGGYLPLIFGAVFTWAAAKALLMERRREQDRNKTVSVDFTRKVRSAA